ncbi:type II and III secretion system protein family protein [Herbaspirillum chlorophenolicum]|uniref:type II and III secretion system protein family protein n=1 Tax=Herbaspirillum chlorophenolicum TaxID=211589 RepID=UPI001E651AB2|nr:type II and III secretion system protein family protein [Herbaspirillum chlorophenolicum]
MVATSLLPTISVMADDASVHLGVHEQRELAIPAGLERIAVANPDVADIVVLRGSAKRQGSVLVVGKKSGTTTVTAWQRNGSSRVWQVTVQSQLQRQQPPAPGGAELQINDDSALLRGQSPSLLEHAYSNAVAANAVGKDKVIDTATIATGGVVQIDVKIVEFSRTALKEAGFGFLFNLARGNFTFGLSNNLPASVPLQTPTTSAFNLVTGLKRGSFNLQTSLELIENNGLARVLAQPTLTALSGQSASFLAGGELPIPQSGGLGTTTIVYKPFGIGLTVTPTVLAPNRIALKVAPEASDIDYTNALVSSGVSIPAITTRRAETTVELGDGESFVIGGLVSRTTKSSLSKVPFLGDLPIIGTFFRSMSYSRDEKELVIVVTPKLVNPIAKGVKLAMPGADKEKLDTPTNAWSAYLMGNAGGDDLPGFSK